MENTSPTPTNKENTDLDFNGLIQNVLEGKSVTKREWDDIKYYAILSEGRLKLHKPDGKLYDWVLSDGDLHGDDYYVI